MVEEMPLRVGVVGLGLMGRRMLGTLSAHAGFEVLAGFDLDVAVKQAVASEFEFTPSANLDELLARDDLDLVYVATPPASHVPIARRVFERGLPLFLEKPLSVDLAEAEELARLAGDHGHVAAMNFPLATLPGLRRFERELASRANEAGSAGKPLRVEITLHFSQWPRSWHHAGEWLAGDGEGGFLREVFSHFAFLTQRVLEPLSVVASQVERAAGRGETRVVADLLAGEVPVSLVGGVGGAAPDFNRWTLYCENRSFRVEDWSIVSISDGGVWRELEPEDGELRGAETQLDELAKLLRGGDSQLPTLRDGLDVMRVVEGLLR